LDGVTRDLMNDEDDNNGLFKTRKLSNAPTRKMEGETRMRKSKDYPREHFEMASQMLKIQKESNTKRLNGPRICVTTVFGKWAGEVCHTQ
jgi:hypothetical protein